MKTKSFLCTTLTACILVGSVPFSAYAQTEIRPLWAYDFSTEHNDIEADGWSWKADSHILSLDGVSVTVPKGVNENSAAIRLPKDSVVYVEHDSDISTESFGCHAIYADGDLTIRGTEKLTLSTAMSNADAIHVYRGDINIQEKVEIEAYPSGSALYVDEGRGVDGVVNITDNAKVEIYDPNDDNFRGRDLEELVRIIYKKPNNPSAAWINYEETYDKKEEKVVLTKKEEKETEQSEQTETEQSQKPDEQKPDTETPQKPKYTLQIGDTAIYKNDKLVAHSDVAPYLSDKGYTMLPLRALLHTFAPDTKIDWDAKTKTATLYYNGNSAAITEHKDTMLINGEPVKMAQPAQTTKKRFFLSLRDFGKLMDISSHALQWNENNKQITLFYET